MQDTTAGLDRFRLDHIEEAHIAWRPDGRQVHISTGHRAKLGDKEPLIPDEDVGHVFDQTEPDDQNPVKAGGKRDRITGFSEGSRRRLRKYVHAVRRDARPLFVTLTYHEHIPDPDECKRDLDVFCKRLKRAYGHAGIIWKMEPQRRGYPHFHLLIYGVSFIPIHWLVECWHDVTAETSAKHRVSGVDIERGVGRDGKLQVYLAKYFSKTHTHWPGLPGPDTAWEHPGRVWGIIDKESIPWAAWADTVYILSAEHAQFLIRQLLDRWGVEGGEWNVPSLTINTRGAPEADVEALLAWIDENA